MQTQHCKIYNILHVLENFHDVRLSLSSLLVNFRFLFCSHHITSHQLECRLSGFVYIHVLFWLKFKKYNILHVHVLPSLLTFVSSSLHHVLSFLLLFIMSSHHVEINLLQLSSLGTSRISHGRSTISHLECRLSGFVYVHVFYKTTDCRWSDVRPHN